VVVFLMVDGLALIRGELLASFQHYSIDKKEKGKKRKIELLVIFFKYSILIFVVLFIPINN
jgi:predicted nucleic acid-binding Zn ribbon protein